MARRTVVALVFSFSLGYCRGTLRGITAFADGRADWDLVPVAPERSARELRRLRPDGVIAHLFDHRLARDLRRCGVPLISTCGLLPSSGIPRVISDDHAIGALAAEHLLARGLRSFASVGHRAQEASRRRAIGFAGALAARGFAAQRWLVPAARAFDPHAIATQVDASTMAFLAGLPRPLGVACANDVIGRQLLELLHGAGIAVPESMAVIGVDDDDLLCPLSRPALSSIRLDAEGIGRSAAARLAEWLDHGRRPPPETLFAPRQVVARRSTAIDAGLDPALAIALAAGRQHINRLAALANVSRRTLERRARRHLGRGIAAELRRRRLDEAKRLLADTSLRITEIAKRTGFGGNADLSRVFRREFAMTPSQWRRGR
jgi:LacI family transcriptional regulator